MRFMVTHKKRNFMKGCLIVVGILLSIYLYCANALETVVLEQEVRCGIQQHIHTDDCFQGDICSCEKKVHTHNENCYLVVLKENDINVLLYQMECSDERSLESIIGDVIHHAFRNNSSKKKKEHSVDGTETGTENKVVKFNKKMVRRLNNTISEKEFTTKLAFNENINTNTRRYKKISETMGKLGTVETEQIELEANTSGLVYGGGISTLSVGDAPSTNSNTVNLYMYIDGSWQCIGNISYTRSGNSGTVTTATLVNYINQQIEGSLTSSNIKLYYTTSSTSTSYSRSATVSGTSSFTLNQVRGNAVKARIVSSSAYSSSSTTLAFYSVTYEYPDGNTQVEYVQAGSTIVLPEGNYIWNNGSTDYDAGDTVTINRKTEFIGTLLGPITSVKVVYDTDFPSVSGVTVATQPTIAGYTGSTLIETLSENVNLTVLGVSQVDVKGSVNGNGTGLSRVIHFVGWRVGTSDEIIAPNTTLLWDELVNYSDQGTLRLYGVWEYDPVQTASFFVRYDSIAVDTEGNIGGQDQTLYTNELFAAYVGGTNGRDYNTLHNLYAIADTSSDNSFGADQEIRALYGADEEGVWLTSFPSDDFVFQELKTYAENKKLSVVTDSGETVSVDPADLNSNAYAVRWYVFKAQSDAWHIDGRLVKKEGLIHVSKTFAGNKELIAKAKEDFYIEAYNEEGTDVHILDLNQYDTYDQVTDTYLWTIENVDHGEYWTITEHPHSLEEEEGVEFSVYAEYTVVDIAGDQSHTNTGTTMTVQGMTYALDEGDVEVLRASFTNIYNKSNSIIIKKQDAKTGNSISGSEFQLKQNGELLRFDYNATTGGYEFNQSDGQHTVLSGNANGYFELLIEDFSYNMGNVTVREVTAPEGYTPADDIVIGYMDEEQTQIGILSGGSGMAKYEDGILIVGNGTDSADVTAKKEWDCMEMDKTDVTVQLLANGRLVTHLLSNVASTVVINEESNWKYTWKDLPTYINGEKITYTLREIQIGEEPCKSDYTFINWIVNYEPPSITFTEQGETKILLNITNIARRVLLRLTKSDAIDGIHLSGAEFLLETLTADGDVDPNVVAKTLVTDSNGVLIFDNLKVGVRYRMRETKPPDGYHQLDDPIYLMIHEDGSVTVEEHAYAESSDNAYNILVYNLVKEPLPETGGMGTSFYYAMGVLLVLAGFCVYINTNIMKRGKNK